MIESHQGIYLRCQAAETGAALVRGAGLTGVVLPGRGGWCQVLLAPKLPQASSLRRLAEQDCAVLYFQSNDYGQDIRLIQRDRTLHLDPRNLEPWIHLGLVHPGVPAQIAQVGLRAISWIQVLKLPPPLHRPQQLWRQRYVPVPGAQVVGLSFEVEGTPSPAATVDGEQLIQVLIDNELLVLNDPASLMRDFRAAWARQESAQALMALLLAHPGLEELYLSDAEWAQAVAAARPDLGRKVWER